MTLNKILIIWLALCLGTFCTHLATAEPTDWAVPIEGNDRDGTLRQFKFEFLGDTFELYFGAELLVAVPRNNRTPEDWAVAIREGFNQAIRDRLDVPRDPLNHPIDGPLFKQMLALLCWSGDTLQFIDPANKPPAT